MYNDPRWDGKSYAVQGFNDRAGRPTVPSTMAEERAANPFLRADQQALADAVGLPGGDPAEVFAAIRQRKDKF